MKYEEFEDYQTDLLHERPAQSSIFLDRMITSKFFLLPPRLVCSFEAHLFATFLIDFELQAEEGCREIKVWSFPSKMQPYNNLTIRPPGFPP